MDFGDAVKAKYFQPTTVGSAIPTLGMYLDANGDIAFAKSGVKVGGFPTSTNAPSPRCVHTGNTPVKASTDGTDATPVVTETYIAEILLPFNARVTGLALFNGSAVAGNVKGIIYNSAGAVLGSTASTAQSGTDAFQRVALSAALNLTPGTYYVGWQFNNTGARFNAHPIGNFGASKKTGETYGTATTITPPTTFTADLGPMGGLY